MLGTVINESNPETAKKIANMKEFVEEFKGSFSTISKQMKNYPSIVPNIVFVLGANNEELGDWLIDKFLTEGQGDIHASIINQIIANSEENRIQFFN